MAAEPLRVWAARKTSFTTAGSRPRSRRSRPRSIWPICSSDSSVKRRSSPGCRSKVRRMVYAAPASAVRSSAPNRPSSSRAGRAGRRASRCPAGTRRRHRRRRRSLLYRVRRHVEHLRHAIDDEPDPGGGLSATTIRVSLVGSTSGIPNRARRSTTGMIRPRRLITPFTKLGARGTGVIGWCRMISKTPAMSRP